MSSDHVKIEELEGEDQLRTVVERDYDRMTDADDAWTILNLPPGTDPDAVEERYEQYESFYRPENFRTIDDSDLLEKTIDIRTMLSRAAVEIQRDQPTSETGEIGLAETSPVVDSVDPDNEAMADIYFRDGLSWLTLEAVDAAIDCFQRSLDYHPGRADALAYYAYLRFKRSSEPAVSEECREELRTAADIAPDHTEIHVLRARFALESGALDLAESSLRRIRELEPEHPDLDRLESVYDDLSQ